MKTLLISDRELTDVDPPVSDNSFTLTTDDELLDAYSKTISAVVSRVAPSVVNIRVTMRNGRAGGGSGFIVARDGFILTNNHVVQGAATLEVTLHDGRSYGARIVGTDPETSGRDSN